MVGCHSMTPIIFHDTFTLKEEDSGCDLGEPGCHVVGKSVRQTFDKDCERPLGTENTLNHHQPVRK